MKILITGFEPIRQFYDVNPSWEAVKELPDEINGVEIIKEEIPIVYDKAERVLEELIEKHHPEAVINVGQSGQDRGIMVEKIGVNWDDFNVPDNAGNMRIDEKVVEDGPVAYFTTLPCRKIAEAIVSAGIPAELSETAGTHLCNHVTYFTRHLVETRNLPIISGFIHVPLLMCQCLKGERGDGRYFMEQSVVTRALHVALETIIGELKK